MKNSRGFTLIELTVYAGLAAVLFLILGIFSSGVLQAEKKNQAIREVEDQGAKIIQMIGQAIRNSSAVESPSIGGSGTSLILRFNDLSQDPTLFSFSAPNILMTVNGNTINLNNNLVKITEVNFNNLSLTTKGSISFSFILEFINSTARPEFNYKAKFYGAASLR